VTTTTLASINNKTTKVKMLKECRFIFILFYGRSIFKKYFCQSLESFYYTERNFTTILVFLGSCHSPKKIAKEQ